MQKIYLFRNLLILLISIGILQFGTAQISIMESLDSGVPAGWTQFGYSNNTASPCEGSASIRDNLWSSSTTGNITSPNFPGVSNGADVAISFQWRTTEFNAGDGVGLTVVVEYSTDNGSNYLPLGGYSATAIEACTPFNATIPAASLPAGTDFKFRIVGNYDSGDFYHWIDDLSIVQNATTVPNCDAALTSAATDFPTDGTLTWSAATGGPTGYFISIGSMSGMTDIANMVDNGASTSYVPTGLLNSATYYVTITPYNAIGNATGCTEETFVTEDPPPTNDDCGGALDYTTAFGAVGANGTCPGNTVSLNIGNYSDAGDDPTCDFGGDAVAWYTWTATTNSVIFTSGTGAPGIEILSGSCGAFTSLGCLNNLSGTISGMTIGISYYIIIWDDGTAGTTIDWCLEEPALPPANDVCGAAIAVGAVTISGTTVNATSGDYPGACGTVSTNNAPGVWYAYTSNGPETVTVDICDAPYDSQLSVWSGGCGALTCVAGDDDSAECTGNDAFVTFTNTETSFAPVVYYIYVYGWSTNTGTFDLTISAAPLPVELVSFAGEAMEKGNKLTWSTASEQGSDYHAIQRSTDGQSNWVEIGRVDAQGDSYHMSHYSFMDERPIGKAYYRLNSVDYDRSYSTSEVVSLERVSNGFGVVSTFPNPTRNNVTVQINSDKNTDLEIRVIDLSGRIVYSENSVAVDGINSLQLPLEHLSAGTYFVRLNNGIETLIERIVKQ